MPEVLVNRVETVTEAQQILERFRQTVEMFLRCPPPAGCWVAEDLSVTQAVAARRPFVESVPEGAATRDVRVIAKRILAGAKPVRIQSLLERL
jgi:MinD-like ATPase involved in chromosome partitioning or flagellar assembly